MKTALITTTIHVPRILELLRRYDSDVRFFIAGDEKSPEDEIEEWLNGMKSVSWLPVQMQKGLGYKCSEIIGWNCIQRRNIALLEALKWGAEIIITHDDDNLPMNGSYFVDFQKLFSDPFDGFQLSSPTGWLNPYGGSVIHRGFPFGVSSAPQHGFAVGAKVGVAAGLCLGNPDVYAVTRMAHPILIDAVAEVHRSGIVVAPDTRTVFNSQNSAFLRQFAPAMFMAPGIGRADDIFASLLTQRVMRDAGYQVHIGPPFTYQERNPHNLLTDLKNEMFCMEHVLEIAAWIEVTPSESGDSVTDQVGRYYKYCSILPQQAREAGLAFLEDYAGVMK